MKKIDLGQTISILANLGVIAGIVFLGIELQQNNALLAAESRAASLGNRMNLREKALDPQIAEVIVRANLNQDLTPVQRLQLFTLHRMQMEQWEWAYAEAELGEGQLPPLDSIRDLFSRFPGLDEFWKENKQAFPSEFREWVDETLVAE